MTSKCCKVLCYDKLLSDTKPARRSRAARRPASARPVTSSSRARASCRSAATNSSGRPRVGRAPRPAQRIARALRQQLGVTHVRDRRACRAAARRPTSAATIGARSSSIPRPVSADTGSIADAGAPIPRRRQIATCSPTTTRGRAVSPRADRDRRSSAAASDRARRSPGRRPPRAAARARCPPASTASVGAPRRPAVSTSVNAAPSMSTSSVRRSRVVPGMSVTIARPAPARRLNRLDCPRSAARRSPPAPLRASGGRGCASASSASSSRDDRVDLARRRDPGSTKW